MIEWSNEDPRYSICKRATIIVVRMDEDKNYISCVANVETKHGWYVHFNDNRFYLSDDKWNNDYKWIYFS